MVWLWSGDFQLKCKVGGRGCLKGCMSESVIGCEDHLDEYVCRELDEYYEWDDLGDSVVCLPLQIFF